MGISYEWIKRILHSELHMWKLFAKWAFAESKEKAHSSPNLDCVFATVKKESNGFKGAFRIHITRFQNTFKTVDHMRWIVPEVNQNGSIGREG